MKRLWRLVRRFMAADSGRGQPVSYRLAQQSARFDAGWYLAQYPDVAASGMDPWTHYLRHGQAEGRLPRRNRALVWDHHLWRGADSVMVPRLQALLEAADASDEERQHAAWALGRWWAWQGDWSAVVACLLPGGESLSWPDHPGPGLLALEGLCRLGESCPEQSPAEAGSYRLGEQVLATLDERFPDQADTALAHANWLAHCGGMARDRLVWINRSLQAHGLLAVALLDDNWPLSLDNLTSFSPRFASPSVPKVSVIVPVYNAAYTLGTALRSLFAQSWPNLEILVLDDASDDESAQALERLAGECPATVEYRVLCHSENQGAYAARNMALAVATGELITTHDSDDWSHPQKIERQVAALQATPDAMACLSHWVRATPELVFHRWRVEEGWVYRNMSSLMFRRRVFERLGYWDEVRVNADSEYHERLLAAFGEAAVIDVLPGVPLAFGRADDTSLSQHSATHLITQFCGVRHDYMAAARRWHQAAASPEALYLPREPGWRPFVAPPALCRDALPVRHSHPLDRLQASGLFDAAWYMRTHIDLQAALIEPLEHYWAGGSAEGRDPGPHFSASGYRRQYPEVVEQGVDPLLHYLDQGRQEGRDPWPVFSGQQAQRPGRATLLLCGHKAGTTLYGAERSLLDVLKALNALEFNVVVSLPAAVNEEYLQALLANSLAVAVLPYGWWQQGKAAEPATVWHFEQLIRRFALDAVHANTLMLDEPLQAARQSGIPAIVHVRELPAHDAALCETLGASAETVGQRVLALADLVIANSHCVAEFFEVLAPQSGMPPIRVVPNTTEMKALQVMHSPITGNAITVGMLSSNQPKKGLADIEAMAKALTQFAPGVQVAIYGPRTPALDALLARQAQGLAPANLDLRGYVTTPAEALAELDVLVNLSRFQESFGRTVLEAMAAGRPVVCYAWGALPELVVDGENGYLVAFAEPETAAQRVAELAQHPERRAAMGQAGRERARERFSLAQMAQRLKHVYADVIRMD